MATHASALKAFKQSEKRAERNKSIKSKIKTFIKKTEALIEQNNYKEAVTCFRKTESELMKSVSKGILKLNTASRKVSKLNHKLKAIEEKAA